MGKRNDPRSIFDNHNHNSHHAVVDDKVHIVHHHPVQSLTRPPKYPQRQKTEKKMTVMNVEENGDIAVLLPRGW
jgi:hypothetical protein